MRRFPESAGKRRLIQVAEIEIRRHEVNSEKTSDDRIILEVDLGGRGKVRGVYEPGEINDPANKLRVALVFFRSKQDIKMIVDSVVEIVRRKISR